MPAALKSDTNSQMLCLLRGSSPVVGSSRNTTSGRTTSPQAMSMRLRIPPEYVLTRRSAASSRSNWFEKLLGPRLGMRPLQPLQSTEHHQVLSACEHVVEGYVLAGQHDRPSHTGRVGDDVVACHRCMAAVRPGERRQDVNGRRLARAVGTRARPSTSPRPTSKLMSRSATTEPKDLLDPVDDHRLVSATHCALTSRCQQSRQIDQSKFVVRPARCHPLRWRRLDQFHQCRRVMPRKRVHVGAAQVGGCRTTNPREAHSPSDTPGVLSRGRGLEPPRALA